MNDDVIADLKQFIAVTISQQTDGLRESIERLDKKVDGIDRKIDDLSAAVAEAIDTTNEATEKQLKDHERRIVRLEHKTA